MSDANENNACIISGPRGLLKLNIMVRKADVFTYIRSLSENLEICILIIDISNKNENNVCIVSGPGVVET